MQYPMIAGASPVAQLVKNPPAMQETWVRSLVWEYPLEKGKATVQSSGLENSMDCIVLGVTKNQTGMSDFHFPYSILCLGYNGLLCFHIRSFLCPYLKFNPCLDRNVYLSFVKLPLICADKLDNSLFIYLFIFKTFIPEPSDHLNLTQWLPTQIQSCHIEVSSSLFWKLFFSVFYLSCLFSEAQDFFILNYFFIMM